MMALLFYFGAVVLFVTGGLLIKNTSPYTRSGGSTYEKRKLRKIVGELLLIAGVLLLGVGILSQFVSSFE